MIFYFPGNSHIGQIEISEMLRSEEGLPFYDVKVGFIEDEQLAFKETGFLYNDENCKDFSKWAECTAKKLVTSITLQTKVENNNEKNSE
jgi:hypothetical protein